LVVDTDSISNVSINENGTIVCQDCFSTEVNPTETSDYTVAFTDFDGCEYEEQFTIKVVTEKSIYVPNIFDLTAQDANGAFKVFSRGEYAILEFNIYNRWGNLIYEGPVFNPSQGLDVEPVWDGTHNGKLTDAGVYIYSILLEFGDGTVQPAYGSLTVVR